MRISSLASLAPLAFFAGVAGLIASAACSNQGEGDYCDLLNGNNDCQGGLTCQSAPGLTGMPGTNTRCCPVSPANATKAVCMGTVSDSGTNTEVGDVLAPTLEASSDGSSSDGPVPEAAAEAGASEPDADAASARAADASDGAPE